MGSFIYGLAVVLVIFEGIITECEGTGGAGIVGSSECPLELLPNDIITKFVQKMSIDGKIKYAKDGAVMKRTHDPITGNILQNSIILISNDNARKKFDVYYEHGNLFVRFDDFEILMSFFEICGEQVSRIYINIDWDSMNESNQEKFVKNIFKTHINYIEELQIKILNDEGFWKKMSNGGIDIKFPQVKKFHITGESKKKKFNLNFIFPNMTSFGLFGNVTDSDCLAEVTLLEELILHTKSISELKICEILKKNNKIEKLSLSCAEKAQTMHSIATYLPNLEKLTVKYPGFDFVFLTSDDSPLHELRSVTHFDISFTELTKYGIGYISFNMPILKKLILNSVLADCRVVYFVKQFKTLDIVEFSAKDKSDYIKCIRELKKHIKEIIIFVEFQYGFYQEVSHLMDIFAESDETTTLQKVKIENVDDSVYRKYQAEMRFTNKFLRENDKPTWTLSHEQTGESLINLIYDRDPEHANLE